MSEFTKGARTYESLINLMKSCEILQMVELESAPAPLEISLTTH